MFKFAVKVGLASSAIYYINEQGIWKDSNESTRTYKKLKDTVRPYVQDVTSQLPIELPTLPESNEVSTIIKQSWNAGVFSTFRFISDLPHTLNTWTSQGIDKALQNQDIKNFVDSFSSKQHEEKK